MVALKNILLISGTGRNTGKTTLACRIITYFSKQLDITALKISPHYHVTGLTPKQLVINEEYRIVKERDAESGKDSSRMLKAGARESIFIQCSDEYLLDAMNSLPAALRKDVPVICESGSLGVFFVPGVHLMVRSLNKSIHSPEYEARSRNTDRKIIFTGTEFDFDPVELKFTDGSWILN
jgi:hypothetical protein